MATESETFAGSEVPYFNGSINRTAGKEIRVKVEAHNSFCVALKRAYTCSSAPVPDFEGSIHASCDKLVVVELQCAHRTPVTSQYQYLFARF